MKTYKQIKNTETFIDRRYDQNTSDIKKILKARAKKLAQRPARKEEAEECLEVLEFILADEKYAIETAYVSEVCLLKNFTVLPCTPPFVFGVINIRGQVLSIIDFKEIFHLADRDFSGQNKLIVVQMDKMNLCILVDDVLEMRLIPLSKIQPPLPTLTGIYQKYLRGVTDEHIVILDAAKFLTDKEIIIDENVGVSNNLK